jgi:DNA-binding MarR family transcriptional regulator
MLTDEQQKLIEKIERRALHYFIEDLLSVCNEEEKNSIQFKAIKQKIS